jgi:hypothetical protein
MRAVTTVLEALPDESKLEGYRLYTTCVTGILGKGMGIQPDLSVALKGLLFGDSKEFVESSFGVARRRSETNSRHNLIYWDARVALALRFRVNWGLYSWTACAKSKDQSVEAMGKVLGTFTFDEIANSVVSSDDLGRQGYLHVERSMAPMGANNMTEEFVFWSSFAFHFGDGDLDRSEWLLDKLGSTDLDRVDEIDIRNGEGGVPADRPDLQWRKRIKPNCVTLRQSDSIPMYWNYPPEKPQLRLRNPEFEEPGELFPIEAFIGVRKY